MPNRYKVLAACIGIILGIGCFAASIVHRPGTRLSLSTIEALDERMESNQAFWIQLTKEGCIYCEALRTVEDQFLSDHNMTLFEYEASSAPTDKERTYFDDRFPPFRYFPALFYVENGEVIDAMQLSDPTEFESEMTSWLSERSAAHEALNH